MLMLEIGEFFKRLNCKMSMNARYVYHVNTDNFETDERLRTLKMYRNFLLATKISNDGEKSFYSYGNLIFTVANETNVCTRMHNVPYYKKEYEDYIKLSKNDMGYVEQYLGINEIIDNGYIVDGYELSPLCFRHYIEDNGFVKYHEILNMGLLVVNYGKIVREWDNKKLIKFGNMSATVTDGNTITNIITS